MTPERIAELRPMIAWLGESPAGIARAEFLDEIERLQTTPVSSLTFDDLTEQVRRLNVLLQDPQPGLSTWCMMYGECMKAIDEYWNAN